MKRLALTLLLLIGATLAIAQGRAAPPAAVLPSAEEVRLVGNWVAQTATNGALQGELTLYKDKRMSLRPKGQPEFVGSWNLPGEGMLMLVVPEAGSSSMQYKIEKGVLTLTYDNGNSQVFKKRGAPPLLKQSSPAPTRAAPTAPVVAPLANATPPVVKNAELP